jgi:CDP-diacylglycerol--glycerol-3-phosphate 3-phosphatidyltransferase
VHPIQDIHFAAGILILAGAVTGVYLVRAFLRGRARHGRTDADGGSVFLHKAVMEMPYWLLGPLVRALADLRVTPNMVTMFSLVPTTLAAVAAAFGWFGLAGVLGTAGALCDLVDGLLARQLGVSSDAGEVVDAAVDRYSEVLLLAGFGIYYRTHWEMLLLIFAALGGSFMFSYTTAKAEALNVTVPRGAMRRAERAVYLLTGAVLTACTRFFFDGFPSMALRQLPIIVALALIAAATNVSAVQRFAAMARALRARGAAPPATPDDVIVAEPTPPGSL